ncbi:hypothetical protein Leryth_023114 [Lithospermum erythrorhizon]|uniref:Uncharacterized protein n=1 Tax=Lithospermum erythrorhizon TaxID=34254 RepID=A0AAV3RHU5_LITER|nr:hypothetical protein Leryth_023114 [Lithospermum erythrorhizon]
MVFECNSCTCTGNLCHGTIWFSPDAKLEWPELVGVQGSIAKATIEKENPSVIVRIVYPGLLMTFDVCCNRVWLILNQAGGHVVENPRVG